MKTDSLFFYTRHALQSAYQDLIQTPLNLFLRIFSPIETIVRRLHSVALHLRWLFLGLVYLSAFFLYRRLFSLHFVIRLGLLWSGFVLTTVTHWLLNRRQQSAKNGKTSSLNVVEDLHQLKSSPFEFIQLPHLSPLAIVRPSRPLASSSTDDNWFQQLEENYFHLDNGMRVHFIDLQLYHTQQQQQQQYSLSRTRSLSTTQQWDEPFTILMIHGRHSWSFLYRHVISLLKQNMESNPSARPLRIVALDLPGCGKSDTFIETTEWFVFPSETAAAEEEDASPTLFSIPTSASFSSFSASSQHATSKPLGQTKALLQLHTCTVVEAWSRFQPELIVAHDYGCELTLAASKQVQAMQATHILLLQPMASALMPAATTSPSLPAAVNDILQRCLSPWMPPSLRVGCTQTASKSTLRLCQEVWASSYGHDMNWTLPVPDALFACTRCMDVSSHLDREAPIPLLDDVLVQRLRDWVPRHGRLFSWLHWNQRDLGRWCRQALSLLHERPRSVSKDDSSFFKKPSNLARIDSEDDDLDKIDRPSLHSVGSFSRWARPATSLEESLDPMNQHDGYCGDKIWLVTSMPASPDFCSSVHCTSPQSVGLKQVHPAWRRVVGHVQTAGTSTGFLPEHLPQETAQWILRMIESE